MKKEIIKIALLGYSNLDLLKVDLFQALNRYLSMYQFEIYCAPYGQLRQEIVNQQSKLYQFNADFCWFCDWCDDFYDPYFDSDFNLNFILEKYQDHLLLVQTFYQAMNIPVYINNPVMLASMETIFDAQILQKALREKLSSFVEKNKNITIIYCDTILTKIPAIDSRLKFLARIPFSANFSLRLSEKFCGYLADTLGKSIRLIILDLDNTLWGGVVGEDGIEGIYINGDYPGNCYAAFQRALLTFKARGILLALASKNDFSIVEEVFKKRKMPLSIDDFVCVEAGWHQKVESIERIVNQINFDYSNVLFVDDSLIECELVSRALPRINVLLLPEDPADYFSSLDNMPLLIDSRSGAKSADRTLSYQNRKHYLNELKSQINLESFLSSLHVKIFLDYIDQDNISRCVELLAKTTQFNLTGKRYSVNQLLTLMSNGHFVISIGVEDIYSKKELMGVLILLNQEKKRSYFIENYVISCRALGKSVEKEALKAALIPLNPNFVVSGQINLTPRNLPAQNLYQELGFDFNQETEAWECSLSKPIALAPWITVEDLRTTKTIEVNGV